MCLCPDYTLKIFENINSVQQLRGHHHEKVLIAGKLSFEWSHLRFRWTD